MFKNTITITNGSFIEDVETKERINNINYFLVNNVKKRLKPEKDIFSQSFITNCRKCKRFMFHSSSQDLFRNSSKYSTCKDCYLYK